jgi:uncharacterized protein YjbI with pentapeptide repeats
VTGSEEVSGPAGPGGRAARLRADCARCFGLCCAGPAFAASADFAIDKPAGQPCPNLRDGFRCGIHADLRPRGFRGCAVYDCFGAGQRVSQQTFGGRDWRRAPGTAGPMFAAFAAMRPLHELLWYLSEALAAPAAAPLHADLAQSYQATEALAASPAEVLAGLDVPAHRGAVNGLLRRASELMRAGFPGPRADHAGADLIGARRRGAQLAGASLRGACLIGADLRQADLRGADFTGADLRDADLRGADLRGAIFLVQAQLDAAAGDRRTRLPAALAPPAHWLPAQLPGASRGGPHVHR